MTWTEYLFSFRGRVSRLGMWQFYFLVMATGLILGTITYALLVALGAVTFSGDPAQSKYAQTITPFVLAPIMLAYMASYIYATAAVFVKRLHDRNRSGIWLLVYFGVAIGIAIGTQIADERLSTNSPYELVEQFFEGALLLFALWLSVEVYILPGTYGDNRYGRDPRRRSSMPQEPFKSAEQFNE